MGDTLKSLLFFTFLLCLFGAVRGSTTWYISTNGTDSNTGTSPLSPLLSLSAALDACRAGDTISVANGVYTGTQNVGLQFTKAVSVVGESELSTVFMANASVSSMFYIKEQVNFSMMTVVGPEQPGSSIGIFVATSNKGGTVEDVTFANLKQGIYYSNFWESASVSRCTFQDTVGTGVYAYTTTSLSVSLSVDSSVFQSASGVWVDPHTYGDWAALSVTRCSFQNSNLVMLYASTPTESLIIEDCDFVGLTTNSGYGAIYLNGYFPVISITRVTISHTQTSRYPAVYATSPGDFFGYFNLTSCWFADNSVPGETSVLWSYGYDLNVRNCGFVRNVGGSLYASVNSDSLSTVLIEDSIFYGNDASSSSTSVVSMSKYEGEATVSGSYFIHNKGTHGGAINLNGMQLDVDRSIFYYNECTKNGGAINLAQSANITVSNSGLIANTADNGGAVYSYRSGVSLSRVILSGNYAATSGGGLFMEVDSDLTAAMCSFTNNYAPSGGAWYLDASNADGEMLLIMRNNATITGGGFGCTGNGNTDIGYALIARNYAPTGSAYSCAAGCQTTLTSVYVAPANTASGCTSTSDVSGGRAFDQLEAELEMELSNIPEVDIAHVIAHIAEKLDNGSSA